MEELVQAAGVVGQLVDLVLFVDLEVVVLEDHVEVERPVGEVGNVSLGATVVRVVVKELFILDLPPLRDLLEFILMQN